MTSISFMITNEIDNALADSSSKHENSMKQHVRIILYDMTWALFRSEDMETALAAIMDEVDKIPGVQFTRYVINRALEHGQTKDVIRVMDILENSIQSLNTRRLNQRRIINSEANSNEILHTLYEVAKMLMSPKVSNNAKRGAYTDAMMNFQTIANITNIATGEIARPIMKQNYIEISMLLFNMYFDILHDKLETSGSNLKYRYESISRIRLSETDTTFEYPKTDSKNARYTRYFYEILQRFIAVRGLYYFN
jgi:hypothetical protein